MKRKEERKEKSSFFQRQRKDLLGQDMRKCDQWTFTFFYLSNRNVRLWFPGLRVLCDSRDINEKDRLLLASEILSHELRGG